MPSKSSIPIAFLLGLALFQSNIAASEPGYLDFDNLPETNFSCEGKVIGGYYADVETGCQMFHVCTIGQKGEVTDIKFLCLNGTVFDQETRVCERIDEVDCTRSESFFGLNLELYGNHPAAQGIQPEEEPECGEQCRTEDYEDDIETTTTLPSPTTSTTTTTTTTTEPPTSLATTPRHHYPSPPPQSVAALLALHNAFAQTLNQHNKPPPPRIINQAFAPSPSPVAPSSTPTPPPLRSTPIDFRPVTHFRPKPTDYIHGYPSHHFPLTSSQKPPHLQSNYHHFESSDAQFTHSFDANKPYNFQYFKSSSTPSPFVVRPFSEPVAKAAVSVVTSTSSSTSVRTSKANATAGFPTGYDEYQESDVADDPFFRDVPKLSRSKRAAQHPNHKYDAGDTKQDKTEFLQNLLGSIDMAQGERKQFMAFFEKEEPEMEKDFKTMEMDGFLSTLQNKIGEIDLNATATAAPENTTRFEYDIGDLDESDGDPGADFTFGESFDQDVDWFVKLNATVHRDRRDASGAERKAQRRQSIDTEVFAAEFESGRKKGQRRPPKAEASKQRKNATSSDIKPVTELVEEGDYTTMEYRRPVYLRPRGGTAAPKASPEPARRLQTRFDWYASTTEPAGRKAPRVSGPVGRGKPSVPRSERRRPVPVYESPEPQAVEAEPQVSTSLLVEAERVPGRRTAVRKRGPPRSRTATSTLPPTAAPPPPPPTTTLPPQDPDFSCEGRVKGGLYADVFSSCRGFFICSQGKVDGPSSKTHFWCGTGTKFDQKSRTCQNEQLVNCALSQRYYRLNDELLVPTSEDELRGPFESSKIR